MPLSLSVCCWAVVVRPSLGVLSVKGQRGQCTAQPSTFKSGGGLLIFQITAATANTGYLND